MRYKAPRAEITIINTREDILLASINSFTFDGNEGLDYEAIINGNYSKQ